MRKLLLALHLLIILVIGSIVTYLTNPSLLLSYKKESNLPSTNIIFQYGHGNTMNTYNQTFTRDTVSDADITVPFKLTVSEIDEIYNKIEQLQVLSTKDKVISRGGMMTPCSSYYLVVDRNNTIQATEWSDCNGNLTNNIQTFTNYMIKLIESKPEYKKIPTPKSGYL